jgi:Holliday junction resolvase RusA-like endonuclease
VDRANVLSVHEKFFCDALVESGCLPDDNDLYIKKTTYVSKGVEPGNGRVEIEITEI